MNVTRIAVLVVAAIAAGAAALLVRGMLGGGTTPVEASLSQPARATAEVLVAAKTLEPGITLTPQAVRWEVWPKEGIAASFITKDAHPDAATFVKGMVTRAPMVTGEPLTNSKIVRAGSANFLAATLMPGKRAVSISVSAKSGAGGFILPNDRVDVILTRDVNEGQLKAHPAETILRDIRVLAMDQTAKQDKDQQSVVAKTATLELSPSQAILIAEAQASGTLSLALRALGDNAGRSPLDANALGATRLQSVTVIRYGVARRAIVPSTSNPVRPE